MDNDTQLPSKKDEILVFFLLLFVVLPVMSVAVIGGYGFVVWMSQLVFGAPGH